MKRFFHGGIHPADNKGMTAGRIPEIAPLPAKVAIHMSQHIGTPCTPLVKIGDMVKLGQKIGDGKGLCVPVHASVSGMVEEIREYPHPGGGKRLAVIIRNDFLDTPDNGMTAQLHPERFTPEGLLAIIREAGVAGMGGATFPTDTKVRGGIGEVDTLIANGCECEPYITSDDVLLCTEPEIVLKGLKLLGTIHGNPKLILAVEDNKKDAIRILRQKCSDFPEIELRVLPTRYPQGAEKQLIKTVTGREVPPGKLPKDVGCGVFNVMTIASVYKAVYEGKAVTERIVTISGDGVRQPKNLIVRIGTSFEEVIRAAGGITADVDKVLAGGPMMGISQETLSAPVVKGTGAILCMKIQPGIAKDPTCIRCGHCVSACPMQLLPLMLYRFAEKGDFDGIERYHLTDCIECGCCSYVCPGKLPLVERFRTGKRILKEGKIV